MKTRTLAATAVLPVLLAVGVALGVQGSGSLEPAACTAPIPTTPTDGDSSTSMNIDDLSETQIGNARIIYTVASGRQLPARAALVALATALQESKLHNSDRAVDHDSLGLFQQRPSQGWGSPEQILDPVHASNAFYDHLIRVPQWQSLPVTDAAQRVQRSAYPGAYAKWEPLASQLVAKFGAEQPAPITPDNPVAGSGCADDGDGLPTGGDVTLPADLTLPAGTPPAVVTAIAWALNQRGTPYHFGGDCTNPHGGVAAHQCDCSSLMQQAYRAAGITIPRTTRDQVHAGIAVPDVSLIAPGDLILIAGSNGTRTNPRHVGMYIGNGLLVQAPHTGDVVKISTLASWQENVAAIRRITA